MKKFFLLLCAALLVLGSALPLVSYRLTRAVLAPEMPAASEDAVPSVPPADSSAIPHRSSLMSCKSANIPSLSFMVRSFL